MAMNNFLLANQQNERTGLNFTNFNQNMLD